MPRHNGVDIDGLKTKQGGTAFPDATRNGHTRYTWRDATAGEVHHLTEDNPDLRRTLADWMLEIQMLNKTEV
jgi:hypothetical protein